MSVRISRCVWQYDWVTATEKIVLLWLAADARNDGWCAYPPIGRMAAECCVSERAVQRTLSLLTAAGHLEAQTQAGAPWPIAYRVIA